MLSLWGPGGALLSGAAITLENSANNFERSREDVFSLEFPMSQDCGDPLSKVGFLPCCFLDIHSFSDQWIKTQKHWRQLFNLSRETSLADSSSPSTIPKYFSPSFSSRVTCR